jgi:hypothetical protein
MPENRITIHHQGDVYTEELNERDADKLSDFVLGLKHARTDEVGPLPQEVLRDRGLRGDLYHKGATDLGVQLKRLAALDKHDLALVCSLMDVIELGESRMSGSNWALDFVGDLLREVPSSGVTGMLEQDPRGILGDLAYALRDYWDTIAIGRELTKRHPTLFPTEAQPKATARRNKAAA